MKNDKLKNDNFIIEDGRLLKIKRVSDKIVIPNEVEVIGKYSFVPFIDRIGRPRGFIELKYVEIPEGVKVIEECAFGANVNLGRVKFPSTLESINSYAFYYCGAIEYELPNNLRHIGRGAFCLNKNLKRLVIPNSVKEVGSYIISECDNLCELVIYDNLSIIGENAFCVGNKYIGNKCYLKKLPDDIVINYTGYEKLNSLLDNLINSGCFGRNSKFRLKLLGPTLSMVESLKIYSKLLKLNASSIMFVYDDASKVNLDGKGKKVRKLDKR